VLSAAFESPRAAESYRCPGAKPEPVIDAYVHAVNGRVKGDWRHPRIVLMEEIIE
jgi:hypothetical protein